MTKNQLLDEIKLRRMIRKIIKIREIRKKEQIVGQRLEEQKLRKIIPHLIMGSDVDADTKPAP